MTFNDIFKNKFLDTLTNISFQDICLSLIMALVIGIFIFFVYKFTFGGVMYSRNFNISLIGLTIMTNFVILAVSSNVVLSLGMVGALSIVRFRTAIKDPMDLVFLFWAIAVGIITGAQFYPLALIGSAIIGVIMFVMSKNFTLESPYLIIVNCENKTSEDKCIEIIKKFFKKCKLKSKVVSAGKGTEFIYEIRGKGENTSVVDEMLGIEGVSNASLISYNGEFLD